MRPNLFVTRRRVLALIAHLGIPVGLVCATGPGVRGDDRPASAGAVYTLSNEASGNELIAFARGPRGGLTPAGAFPTGGLGTGGGLHNQGALALSPDRQWLFAVNPGSDTLSVFSLQGRRPRLTQVVPSGGRLPISLTARPGLLYVLHSGGDAGAGGADSLVGFTFTARGLRQLTAPIPLSGTSTGPAQVGFTPDGTTLVVTERMTNAIDTYRVGASGVAHGPDVQASSGMTPFGFAFTPRGQLVVAEAFGGAPGASKVSLYDVSHGRLTVKTASAPTMQTAACWTTTTTDGKFAYTSNTPAATLTGLRIHPNSGAAALLDPLDGLTAMTGGGSEPTDGAVFSDRVLYVLNSGLGQVIAFGIRPGGGLTPLDLVWGFPANATGLVVR